MPNSHQNTPSRLACVLAFLGLPLALTMSEQAQAANYYWDPTGGDGQITEGSGNLDTTTSNWTTDGGATQTTISGSNPFGEDLKFGSGTAGTAGTVTVTVNAKQFGSLEFLAPNAGTYDLDLNGNQLILRRSANTLKVTGTSTTISDGATGGSLHIWGHTQFRSTGNLSISAVVSNENAGTLSLYDGISVDLSGVNTFTSDLLVGSGSSLIISGAGQLGSGAYAGTISNSGTFNYNSSADQTLSGAISGAGALTKNGSGTLTLATSNTYTGATTVSAGTLAVTGNISTSATTVASGATLNGSGGVVGAVSLSGTMAGTLSAGAITVNSGGTMTGLSAGDITLDAGGILSPAGNTTAGSMASTSITINGGEYNWTLNTANGTAGSGWDQITSGGALTSSGLLTVYAYGTPGDWDNAANYSWDIISANSVTGFNSGNFTIDFTNFGIAAGNRTGTWAFSNPSGGIIRLSYTATGDPVWAGGTGNWNVGFSPGVTEGDAIAFSGAGGTATNNISNGTLTTVNDIEFRNGAGAYTLAANAGSAGASGGMALTVNGSIINNSTNTQTINTALAFAATRTVDASTGDITIGGVISGSGGLTKNGSNTLTLTGANTYTGTTTINAGTLQVGSGSTTGSLSASTSITNDATLAFNRSNDLTVSNTISGSGDLIQNGSGTLTLSGASSSYTGTTTLNAGTLQMNHANALGSGGNVTFSGGELKYGSGITTDLSGRVKNSGSAILVDTNSQTVTWSTALSSTNSGGLTKNGTGTLKIHAQSAYSGTTTINAGTLQIDNSTGGTKTWGAGSIAINNGSTLEITGNAQTIFNINDPITFDSNGGGTMLLTKNPIFRDVTVATSGGSMNTISGTYYNGQGSYGIIYDTAVGTDAVALQVSSQHTNLSYFTKNGSGNLTLTGTNTYTGATTINAGTLEIGGTGSLGSGTYAGNIANAGTLTFNSTTDQTLSGVISGAGALVKNAASKLTVSNANTYSGATTISAGTLEIGGAGTLGSGGSYAGNISNSGTFSVNSSAAQTLSGVISGSGALTKNGSGTLTLTGANTYSGDTRIEKGTLNFQHNDAFGTSLVNMRFDGGGTQVLEFGANGLDLSENVQISNQAGTKTIRLDIAGTNTGTLSGQLDIRRSVAGDFVIDVGASDTLTVSGSIVTLSAGGAGITKNGTGTLTLTGNNSFTGGATLNAGTLVIGHVNAAGTGNITQSSGSSLLKFDITGTVTNDLSIYNVATNQTITLSGDITAQNTTYDVASGTTLSLNGSISGSGGITKNGTGTLEVNGASNTYTGDTVVNAGTLEANASGALGASGNITVHNGGSLLVQASNAINDSASVNLSGGTWGFNGNISDTVGALTLSANSTIDMDNGNISLFFSSLGSELTSSTRLNVYNYTLDSDHIYFTSNANLSSSLPYISFYSGFGTGFIGSSFVEGLSSPYQVRPVPEPETWATAALLLIGGGIWLLRRKKQLA